MTDLKSLHDQYRDYESLEEVAYFSSQDLNIDLVGCVREVLTPETADYISKFILQHLDHYMSYCMDSVDGPAVKAMEQLISTLYNEYGTAMSPEVSAVYKELAAADLSLLAHCEDGLIHYGCGEDFFYCIQRHDTFFSLYAVDDKPADLSRQAVVDFMLENQNNGFSVAGSWAQIADEFQKFSQDMLPEHVKKPDGPHMDLSEFLGYFDFDYELVWPDDKYEMITRQRLIENGDLLPEYKDSILLCLIDLQGAYLGNIGKERYPLEADSVSKIIDRMDIYINDSVISEFVDALEDRGIDTSDMSLETMASKCKELDVGTGEVSYVLAEAVIHPEQVYIKELQEPSIYLSPVEPHSWSASVSFAPPSADAIKLTAEQIYPVEMMYRRADINGSWCYESDTCQNQKELLDALNWCGTCRWQVLDLWDFDLYECQDESIWTLFNDASAYRAQLAKEDLAELLADDEPDHETVSTPLANLLTDAQSRAKAQQAAPKTPSKDLGPNLPF